MSAQRRHPIRQVDGKRTAKAWGKSGKVKRENKTARVRERSWMRRLVKSAGEDQT